MDRAAYTDGRELEEHIRKIALESNGEEDPEVERQKESEKEARLVVRDDLEKLVEDKISEHVRASKHNLEKYRQEWKKTCEMCFDVLDGDGLCAITGKELCRLSALVNDLNVLSWYNVPDKDGHMTDKSKESDRRFMDSMIKPLVEMLALRDLEKTIMPELVLSAMDGRDHHDLVWLMPDPDLNRNHRWAHSLAKRVLERILSYLRESGVTADRLEKECDHRTQVYRLRWGPPPPPESENPFKQATLQKISDQ